MKKFIVLLSVLMLSMPCFAQTYTTNKIWVDMDNYVYARRYNINSMIDYFNIMTKFFETYSYPTGWTKLVTADVMKSTASQKPLDQVDATTEAAAVEMYKPVFVNMFRQMGFKAAQDPNMNFQFTPEQKQKFLNTVMAK